MSRDRLHLKAPDHWINDPNGFIYYQGNYHLFYQYFPYGTMWGTPHWGHAVSRDLVNWEHKGIALFPTKRGDQNGCFSGSAVEKDGRLYLVYTGVRYEEADPENIHLCLNSRMESVQMMISSADGFRFDNWNGKEVIIPPITDKSIGDRTDTRDPKIWRGKDGCYYLILGSTREGKQGRVLFYRSRDLHAWTYVNQAAKGSEYGWMWECPDYFEARGGQVLMLSAMGIRVGEGAVGNHTICFPVEFREDNCELKIPDDWQLMDYGLDLYASQTAADEEGRAVMVAWLRMPEPDGDGRIGMFCSPRVAEVEDGHIYFRIHPNIRQAYSKEISAPSQADPAGYMASFALEEGEEVDIGGFRIGRKGNRIYTDRSAVFPAGEDCRLASETPEVKKGFRVEALVDRNMVEVFVNDGEYVITNAVYGLGHSVAGNGAGNIRLYTVEAE